MVVTTFKWAARCAAVAAGLVAFAGCTLETDGGGAAFDPVDDAFGEDADGSSAPDAAPDTGVGETGLPDADLTADTSVAPDAASDVTTVDAETDTSVVQDGPDDVSLPDAQDATVVEAGPCVVAENVCDMDCDGHTNATCGGNDCCDKDERVFVGQTAWFTQQSACGGFDYDCNGDEQMRHTSTGDGCHACWLVACCADDGDYVSTVPACGHSGVIAKCVTWPACGNTSDQRAQECR